MTILQAASALVDDLVASGSFSRSQVSACDYGVIDTSRAACAVILQPAQSSFTQIGYGGVSLDDWGITAECFIKVTGNSIETMSKCWHIIDAVKGAVNSGTITNCASLGRSAWATGATKSFGQVFSLHGHDIIPVFINILVREDP